MNLAFVNVMQHAHAVLWIDQHEAKLFHFDRETFDVATLKSAHRHVRRHPSVTAERAHPADTQHYFAEVARALDDTAAILVVGPSTAKLHFLKYVQKHAHGLDERIVGIETVDHPTDGQLVTYARKYFHAADRMR